MYKIWHLGENGAFNGTPVNGRDGRFRPVNGERIGRVMHYRSSNIPNVKNSIYN